MIQQWSTYRQHRGDSPKQSQPSSSGPGHSFGSPFLTPQSKRCLQRKTGTRRLLGKRKIRSCSCCRKKESQLHRDWKIFRRGRRYTQKSPHMKTTLTHTPGKKPVIESREKSQSCPWDNFGIHMKSHQYWKNIFLQGICRTKCLS